MFRLVLKRLGISILTLLAVSVILFLGTKILPGDAAQIRLGQEATAENLAALRQQLGLDLPLWQQYWNWLYAFVQGDFGASLSNEDFPISKLIADRYENTLWVFLLTAMIGIPISLAIGVMAAMYPQSSYDRSVTFTSVSLVSAPEFLIATLLVLLFVRALGWTSPIVTGGLADKSFVELLGHFALPVATLCFVIAAQLIRMTRAAVLNVMSSPYIEMAILKGLPRSRIILHHALPNAIGPIVNIVALNLAYLVSGVVIIEVFFAYNGLATLTVQGVQQRDFIMVQSLGMIFCVVYVVLLLISDIASILSNPRLRNPK